MILILTVSSEFNLSSDELYESKESSPFPNSAIFNLLWAVAWKNVDRLHFLADNVKSGLDDSADVWEEIPEDLLIITDEGFLDRHWELKIKFRLDRMSHFFLFEFYVPLIQHIIFFYLFMQIII